MRQLSWLSFMALFAALKQGRPDEDLGGSDMAGPLHGLRIIEIAGIGPGPFAGMMLADHGADVIRVERPNAAPAKTDILARSRRVVAIDLKQAEGVAVLRDLARGADGLIEGFRPGVMERLGVGPDVLLADNPKLVFGRMTGWGQTGPLAKTAGHDIDYIAVAGALHAYGRAGQAPTPPINMVGDFGGGGMMLAFGMVSAILHAQRTGQGQVVDCAMVDGAAVLMSMIWSLRAAGVWRDERGVNMLDTGAHFYDTYETSDGKWLAVGAIEPQFYAEMRRLAGLADDPALDSQMAFYAWPEMKAKLAAMFRTRTRDAWAAIFDGTDACVSPVLSMAEAPAYAHNVERGTFIEADGVTQPAPAPRYSVTVADRPRMAAGADTDAVLASIGYDAARVAALRKEGVLF
jgi:alpha-methylacyl-CoA racemase